MRDLKDKTVIITGASRGLGTYIARVLAKEQMKLVLVARTKVALEEVAKQLREMGCQVLVIPTDITDKVALEALVTKVHREFGGIDVLVNNAGIITLADYHQLTWKDVDNLLQVNLFAPLLLTWLVLPTMLAQRRGHIVNISSLAGKVGTTNEECYSSTKAGLISFTTALRASYQNSGVSASVICPGLIKEVGMFQRAQNENLVNVPPLLGSSSPNKVALSVVRAIKLDLPEVIINPIPVRPFLAFHALFPRLANRVLSLIADDIARKLAYSHKHQIL